MREQGNSEGAQTASVIRKRRRAPGQGTGNTGLARGKIRNFTSSAILEERTEEVVENKGGHKKESTAGTSQL
jgi:hypothetical protein